MSLDVGSPKYAKAQRAFEARAQTLVGLPLAAVRYVGGIHNSAGYERGNGVDRLNFGAALVSADGRCVYIEWESGESGAFKIAIHDCKQLVGRSVTDVSADDRWEPFVGETVTNIDVASRVDDSPWLHCSTPTSSGRTRRRASRNLHSYGSMVYETSWSSSMDGVSE